MSETSPFSLDSCALPLMEALIATQAVIVFDPQGYIAFVNNGFCEVMGYSPDALIGAHHRSFMPPGQADLPAYEAHWESLRAGRSSTATVLRLTAQGEERWLHGTYIPVRCNEGTVRWVLKTVTDVTAAEQERRTLAGEAEAVSQANAVIRFSPLGQILDANENFCKAMGYRLDQIKGRHHRLFVDPSEGTSPAYQDFWRKLAAGESMVGEFRRFRADGQEIWLPASYSPIRDRLGRVVAVVKVAQLSSARKQLALLAEVSQTLGSAGSALERSSLQISQAVETQQGTVSTQAAAVAEVTSSLSELRQTSAQALEQAENLLSAAERTQDTSAQGHIIVGQSVDGMRDIRACVEVIQGRILALSDHTAQIGDIIATVNEIAEQSKLLALNASIEAARAGEFGKSFSVVANEMRDLAEQSKGATRQVRQLLSDIREATGAAVVATEDGIAKVDMGQGLANKAGEIMETLGTVISQSVDASRLIANASRQQGAGVSQVADAMISIDRASRSTAQGMAEVQQGMSQLREIARQMADRVRELQGGGAAAA